ncbi:MAG: class I SAM-dependent methyltransferase, partial [Candidatus Methylomirabilis sp.]
MSGNRLIRVLQKRVAGQTGVPFALKWWDGRSDRFGEGEPVFQIAIQDHRGWVALSRLDELAICEAYVGGFLDITGDMLQLMGLRDALTDRHPLYKLWRRLSPLIFGQLRTDSQAITQHYDVENDFHLIFMDPSRIYSHGLFENDDELLETAQRRKLDFAIEACRLAPGQQVLDVGGGWGGFTEHAGRRGIRVTSLTISRESLRFLTDLVDRLHLPCRALYENFLTYRSAEPYDAIVVLGVMEHLPNYRAALKQFHRLLKPGGRVYIDASAARKKSETSSFISRHIYPGNHSFFCLHDFLAALAETPFALQAIHNDHHSYYLTCKAWAENLERARGEVIRRWGERLYRTFRIYLWGSVHGFLSDRLQAYRVVLE